MTSKFQRFEEFIKYIEKPNSDYPWVIKDLPENPSAVDRLKFEICQKLIDYKQKNGLTVEELAKRIHLDIDASVESHREKLQKDIIQKILFCWVENFDLEELIIYTEQLSLSIELKISFGSKLNVGKVSENFQGEWDETLNDQKILEIIQAKVNKKLFEPLLEPLLLWGKEVFYVETAYRSIKYRMIFWLKESEIYLRNIWVIK
jgi:hypothetical protein